MNNPLSTPVTGYVRESYAREKHPGEPHLIELRREGFDRWLEAHDAEIRAEQIEADAEAVERIRHHHRASDFGSGWWNSMVDDAVAAIRAQLTPRTPTPGPFDDVRDVVDQLSVYKKG